MIEEVIEQMKRMIKASDPDSRRERKHDPRMYSDEGYWFSTKHGIQPGSIPRDVEILDTRYEGSKSFVKFDRFLTTEELNFYDMKEESPQSSEEIPEEFENVTGGYDEFDDDDGELEEFAFEPEDTILTISDTLHVDRDIAVIIYEWYDDEDAWEDFDSLEDFAEYVKTDIYDMIDACDDAGLQEMVLDAVEEGKDVSSAAKISKVEKVPSLTTLEEELKESAREYMTSPEGGFLDDEVEDYVVVEAADNQERYDIEVRAELSYDGFQDMIEGYLDPIVQKYDKDAYFEMESPGIAVCIIWKVYASEIIPNKQIQKGMQFTVDGFNYEVTDVSPNHKTCTVTSNWIAEDTGREHFTEKTYSIATDGDEEYIYDPNYESYAKPGQDDYSWWARKYATGADNYPWSFDDEEDDADIEDQDDEYTPSSTARDYSPSNPWDAPGMSVKDFI